MVGGVFRTRDLLFHAVSGIGSSRGIGRLVHESWDPMKQCAGVLDGLGVLGLDNVCMSSGESRSIDLVAYWEHFTTLLQIENQHYFPTLRLESACYSFHVRGGALTYPMYLRNPRL